ncbi:hypothetical protein SAMN04487926_12161 [Paraburkholderia steynii]|uniref:Large polyvalent protein associated domain-containing protein n=1 Tax=Paraburkholderia steynii TaxID=1245441 RepID=A0A7Z7FJT2_9BURK|nr:hypothetical protein [Paraburkholderia steynii]SDI65423.1 hypothetical protein SAMN04487926_12161 [Paraburkholderia steynii]
MHDKCANAVQAVRESAGRKPLTKAELDHIEDRVRAGMRSVANKDIDAWRGMSTGERITAGAEWASKQLTQEAELAKQRKLLQVSKQLETQNRIEDALYADPERAHDKNARQKVVKADIEQTYVLSGAIKADYMRQTMASIDAMKHGQNFVARAFDVDNPAMERDIVREIYKKADGSTGNDVAKAAAEQISKTNEAMRKRFNASGGNVGDVGYGYVPIRHSQAKVLGNGSDVQRRAWADFVLPLLDRSKYLNDNGDLMSDAEVRQMLTGEARGPWQEANIKAKGKDMQRRKPGIWDEIAGTSPREITTIRGAVGARANANSEHRFIHFVDADAHFEYNRAYGEGSLLNATLDHVNGMAKNIALVERYGPNPTRNIMAQIDRTAEHDGTPVRILEKGPTSIGAYWDYVNGNTNTPIDPTLARNFQTVRTTVGAIKLQGTLLAALGDVGTTFVTANYNKVPFFRTLGTAARLMAPGSKDLRDWLSSQGLIAENLEHGLTRWGQDNLATDWAKNLSAATMKFGGVTGWTDALRTGFQANMMRGLAEISKTPWAELTEWDRRAMSRAGIAEHDWSVVNQAEPSTYGSNKYLTPDSIYETGHPDASNIAPKLLGMIREEGEFAVLNPDLTTKVIASGNSGTWKGELQKTFMQFKSFPIAMITRHWGRLAEMRRSGDYKVDGAPALANPLAYGAALIVSTTLIGAITTEIKNILAGKDPESVGGDLKHAASFWTRAFTTGGGAGFAGDMLNAAFTSSDYGSLLSSLVGGPVLSTIFQPVHALAENAADAAEGKDTHVAADLVKVAKSNLPLLNLWYWKTVMNRLIWDNVAESVSPGVTQRNINKSNKEYGNDYWWSPGQTSPERAPNLATIAGAP